MAVKQRSHSRARVSEQAAHRGISISPVLAITWLLLLVLPVFFTPGHLLDPYELPKVSLLVTGALILAAWWIAAESSRVGAAGFLAWARHLGGRISAAIRRDPLGGAVALFFVSAILSTLTSVRPGLSLFGAPQSESGLRTIFGFVAIYYASRSLSSRSSWFLRIAQASAAAAAIATILALSQIVAFDPFSLQWHREVAFTGIYRAFATFGQPVRLTAYLVLCLPLVLWLAVRARGPGRIAGLVLTLAILFVLAASLSRGAWIALLVEALVAIVLARAVPRRVPRTWIGVALGILLLAFVVPLLLPMRHGFITRVQQVADVSAPSSRARLELWRAGLRMTGDHPLLGAGVDAFGAAFPKYRSTELTRIEWGGSYVKCYNDAIQVVATQGIVGGIAALALLVFAARAVWRAARRGDPDTNAAAVAAGAALAGYLVPSLVSYGSVATGALAAALAGWAARASRGAEVSPAAGTPAFVRTPGEGREGPPVRSFWNLAAGVALAAVLWFWIVWKPLQSEIFIAKGMRSEPASLDRDEQLAYAATAAPWDPRPPAELGRSLFAGAMRERDADAAWSHLVRARTALEQALRIAPENGENHTLLASVLAGQAVFHPGPETARELREQVARAIALDPLNPEVLVASERAFFAAGLVEDARRVVLQSVQTYPEYAPPLADLGSLALDQGRHKDAADTLELAVHRSWGQDVAGSAAAWTDLARARLALGRNAEAIAAADSALALDPRQGQAFATKEMAKRAMSTKQEGGNTKEGSGEK